MMTSTTTSSAAGERPEGVAQRPTARMLDIAEQLGTLIEAGVWTTETFPLRPELGRLFRARKNTMRGALMVAVARGVVVYGVDPASPRRRRRYLPCAPESGRIPATGAERVAQIVAERIADGQWNADTFPSLQEVARELRCGSTTAEDGMKLAASRGHVRKVYVPRPASRGSGRLGRGRVWAWRPANAPADLAPYERLAADIRAGVLTGQLPYIRQMGRALRVSPQVVADAYARLAEEGLAHRVTVVGGRKHLWHVLDGSEPYGRRRHAPTAPAARVRGDASG